MPDAAAPTTAASPAMEACKRDRLKMVLAVGAMVYLTAFTVLLFLKGMPTGEAAGVADTLAGGALMLVKDAFSFVFGSSEGSQAKDATIAAMTPPQNPTQPT